jgi:flagellin-like protein
MLKRLLTQKKYFKHIYKSQQGITGLETAIILIAFVVVAAVFAYTVLSAGLFSTQKSQEAVYSGLQETQSTLKLTGAVVAKAEGMIVNGCESTAGWTNGADATLTAQSVTVHEGTNAMQIDTTAAGVETLAYHAMTAKAMANGNTFTFWIYIPTASNAALGGHLHFTISATTDLSAGTQTTAALAPAADTWTKVTLTLAGGNDTTDLYYGIYQDAAGSGTFYIDDIQTTCDANLYTSADSWIPFGNKAIFTLSLANGGNPIDFTTGTDTNSDGLIETHTNKVVINYSDSNQTVNDIAWAASFVGKHNGSGNLLDQGDKVQITVDLTYINQNAADAQKLIQNHQFTLEVKPATGAVMTITRTMPDKVNTINDLN